MFKNIYVFRDLAYAVNKTDCKNWTIGMDRPTQAGWQWYDSERRNPLEKQSKASCKVKPLSPAIKIITYGRLPIIFHHYIYFLVKFPFDLFKWLNCRNNFCAYKSKFHQVKSIGSIHLNWFHRIVGLLYHVPNYICMKTIIFCELKKKWRKKRRRR